VNHAIQSSRKMALGISPVTLERGGLLPALQTLIAWSRDSYNIGVTLRLFIRSPLLIGESAAAHLYLIVQEAINNAVRPAALEPFSWRCAPTGFSYPYRFPTTAWESPMTRREARAWD
jgi:signal transduction histidine kinase